MRTERIAMLAPAGVAPPTQGERSGYWVEVHDAAGEPLYHRPLHDPLRADIEVFGEGPEEAIHRVPNKRREGEFEVIVPDLPGASRLVLYGTPAKAKTPHTPAKELLSYDFAELRQLDVNSPTEAGSP